MSTTDLNKPYDPTDVEPRWYARWTAEGYFRARDKGDNASAFAIAIPPPNVTGSLHMGHALMVTIQDAIIRHARMSGRNTLWLPGIDHAGIATQVVVERELALEGKNRHDLGREAFTERVWAWKARSGNRIYEQIKVMGASPDWDRAKFTMDPDLSVAVREAFVRLYEEGLIYRANRMVNWCVTCRTVLSDLEVEREEPEPGTFNAELFSFAYPLEDGSGEIVVATTRPETMVGDTAVAVHPDDPRYKHLIGKKLRHPFLDRTFPIIGDGELADPTKGTGAVKVTPAHDVNDFACGQRNGLELINILNPDGTLNAKAGPFAGMDRFVAREAVKKALEDRGLARGSVPHAIPYARCQRSNTILEPIPSPQWYVRMKPLAEPAIQAVQDGKTTFTPEEWSKTYMHWMTHIEDWCISRQLWWGHQIPVWYCDACDATMVSRTDVTVCTTCGAASPRRDPDVLDTWFSSALWPFSTLGWPASTEALRTFYPTSVMETGFDIIFFWVARMMMMGLHFLGDVPFRKVLLHGMVCDENGSKMSKVKGNVIDPLDLVHGATLEQIVEHASGRVPYKEGYKKFALAYPGITAGKPDKDGVIQPPAGFPAFGADAVRFYLASHPPQSRKINLKLTRLQGYRDFCNKIWNAVRFSMNHIADVSPLEGAPPPTSVAERWLLSRLAHTVSEVERGITDFRLDEATAAIYQFFWYELCDWFLELSKPVFEGGSEDVRASYKRTLARAIEVTLRLLHPFMPYLTEETWARLPDNVKPRGTDGQIPPVVMVAPFPGLEVATRDLAAESSMAVVRGVIESVRSICGELGIKQGAAITVTLRTPDPAVLATLADYDGAIRKMTRARDIVGEHTIAPTERPRGVGFALSHGVEVLVPLAGHIDPARESLRLAKDIEKTSAEAAGLAKRLDNQAFVARAPVDVVEKDRARLVELRDKAQRMRAALDTVRELTPA